MNRYDRNQIIRNIQQIYITCTNLNDTFRVLLRADNSEINYTNESLKVELSTHGYQFLCNGNIILENVCRDGLHLTESGKNLLLENYAHFLYHC